MLRPIGEETLFAVVAEAFHTRTETLLRRGLSKASVSVTDVTSGWALLSIQGPRSRSLLERVTTADLSNDAFPYLTAQELDLHHARGYAFRMETLESTRTEAGRRDYGLDMENTDTALEAGLGFAVDLDGPVDFIGKQALLEQRENRPLKRRLVQLLLGEARCLVGPGKSKHAPRLGRRVVRLRVV